MLHAMQRRIHIAEADYGADEIQAVLDTLDRQRLALVAGPRCDAFERRAAEELGVASTILVNSGSSALLLALSALALPPGSEVITPALTFGTTVAPLLQLGLVPVFVDVAPGRLVVTPEQVASAIGPATRAILVPDLVGDVPDWAELRSLADTHGLALVDDAADTWAPAWDGRSTASWADIGITSFYASHMLTLAGTGGLVATDDPLLAERVRTLRGWGRRSAAGGEKESIEARATDVDGRPYDTKYTFDVAGYNLLPSEIGAAFGLVQLERMEGVRTRRAQNHAQLAGWLQAHPDRFEVPGMPGRATSTWHALPFRVRGAGQRDRLARHLESHGIQTRPVLAGNLTRQPLLRHAPHRIVGALDEADRWMDEGLMIGIHQRLEQADLEWMLHVLRTAW